MQVFGEVNGGAHQCIVMLAHLGNNWPYVWSMRDERLDPDVLRDERLDPDVLDPEVSPARSDPVVRRAKQLRSAACNLGNCPQPLYLMACCS
jgi:hypothetical protein